LRARIASLHAGDLCWRSQRRVGFAALDVLAKMMQQDRPRGVALAEIAARVRPTAMHKFYQRSPLVGG
jgi:hypothetical protein